MSVDDVMAYSQTDEAKAKAPQVEGLRKNSGWYLLKIYLDVQEVGGESGQYNAIPEAALHEMLRPVQDLLRNNYLVVGLLEEFNTTISLFDAALGMFNMNWHREFSKGGKGNVDRKYKTEKEEALKSAWTNSEIKLYIKLDLLLYEHTVDLFHQQIERYGLNEPALAREGERRGAVKHKINVKAW